ncbi:hypothetical protein KUCAC02_025312, partial [Chaenocephalus aceratus]
SQSGSTEAIVSDASHSPPKQQTRIYGTIIVYYPGQQRSIISSCIESQHGCCILRNFKIISTSIRPASALKQMWTADLGSMSQGTGHRCTCSLLSMK